MSEDYILYVSFRWRKFKISYYVGTILNFTVMHNKKKVQMHFDHNLVHFGLKHYFLLFLRE